jgi:hypothetical protein
MHLSTRLRFGYRLLFVWMALAGILAAGGCGGDSKVRRYPVNGSVNVDGKPAAGVMLIFCPTDGPPEVQKLRPSGFTDADGKFQLMSITPNDGAPAAHYKVLVQWPTGSTTPNAAGMIGGGQDRLKGRYMNLEKSPFTVDIKPGTNDLPPFDVKSK